MYRNYKDLKTLNPKLPILIRESSGVEPQLWARYGNFTLRLYFCQPDVSEWLRMMPKLAICELFLILICFDLNLMYIEI